MHIFGELSFPAKLMIQSGRGYFRRAGRQTGLSKLKLIKSIEPKTDWTFPPGDSGGTTSKHRWLTKVSLPFGDILSENGKPEINGEISQWRQKSSWVWTIQLSCWRKWIIQLVDCLRSASVCCLTVCCCLLSDCLLLSAACGFVWLSALSCLLPAACCLLPGCVWLSAVWLSGCVWLYAVCSLLSAVCCLTISGCLLSDYVWLSIVCCLLSDCVWLSTVCCLLLSGWARVGQGWRPGQAGRQPGNSPLVWLNNSAWIGSFIFLLCCELSLATEAQITTLHNIFLGNRFFWVFLDDERGCFDAWLYFAWLPLPDPVIRLACFAPNSDSASISPGKNPSRGWQNIDNEDVQQAAVRASLKSRVSNRKGFQNCRVSHLSCPTWFLVFLTPWNASLRESKGYLDSWGPDNSQVPLTFLNQVQKDWDIKQF